MCGIGGILHWDKEPVESIDLDRMVGLLRHRGPDESGVAVPTPWVGLSHCRLKIIDLSHWARQPMTNPARLLWLVYNGEIYNFRELKKELERAGSRFQSQSDTEVLLRAYEVWGTDGIRRLDGMFAFALWDGLKQQLILARDRTGKKPLFYWTDGRCLAFGSEIKAVVAHPHVPCRFDEEVLPHLLAFGYPPSGRSCYRGIRQVPPAGLLCFRAQDPDPSCKRYWTLPTEPVLASLRTDEAVQRLRQLLTDAIRRRLIADVPLGAFLSGGLDSSIVVGLMAKAIADQPVKTFSIGFEGDSRFDETRFAGMAAARFRTEHTVFRVGPQSFDLVERLVGHHDQPFGDSSGLPTYLLSELTRSHVTVALTGDGGDELFAGYDRFRAVLLSQGIPLWLRRVGSGIFQGLPRGSVSRSFWGRAQRFFQAAQEPVGKRFFHWVSLFQNPEGLLLSPESRFSIPEAYRNLESSDRGSLLSRLLILNLQDYLPNDLHVKTDRCSMAHGLEVRSPFLDTALMEWAFRLPDSFKLRAGVSKWILRMAFRDEVPRPILRRTKMGFGVPLAAWFRGRWREPMQDYLSLPNCRIARYLNRTGIESLIRQHLEGSLDAGQQLWFLLTFEVWLRNLEQPLHVTAEGLKSYA